VNGSFLTGADYSADRSTSGANAFLSAGERDNWAHQPIPFGDPVWSSGSGSAGGMGCRYRATAGPLRCTSANMGFCTRVRVMLPIHVLGYNPRNFRAAGLRRTPSAFSSLQVNPAIGFGSRSRRTVSICRGGGIFHEILSLVARLRAPPARA
jgi:hypothetical protein